MKSEVMRISHELQAQNEKIKENTEKIKVNKTLPYLVSNVIEVFITYFYVQMWILFLGYYKYRLYCQYLGNPCCLHLQGEVKAGGRQYI